MVLVKKLGPSGHETIQISVEEAESLIEAEKGRYFVRDKKTGQILHEIHLEEDQEIALIPIATGG